ncbi:MULTISPECIES: ArsR family transcriptional regulator [Streptomyces]|uniref:ArsR family transcriptional regulator n=1 Tax=Streptomyces TaxID=1883 RepID=UPI001B3255EB|nr:ArsR family transcriptional regulator [Streptomyces sp. AgN23]AJZ87275.2 ArsR family transcriptional regulator [Streptomyces sp. AgN23]
MGLWLVDADTLARSRFVRSALAETTAALVTLERASAAHPGERAWLDAHLPSYRARLADDPIAALLVRAALGRTWLADFLTQTPGEGEPSLEEELARMRATPPAAARRDLAVSLGRSPLPAALCRDDLPGRLADLLEWVWTEAVRPSWPRRRRIIEADVVARTGQVSQGGWAATLDGLRPGMRWLGGSRLRINAHDHPPRAVHGAQLLLVPVTPTTGWVSWDAPHRYAVIYPCAGALTTPGPPPAPDSLARLLGPARASVLVLLDTPKSTTHLVALTGQTLGSVGRHLRVLREARLVRRRRAGRSVLYYRTTAGEVLVEAQRTA